MHISTSTSLHCALNPLLLAITLRILHSYTIFLLSCAFHRHVTICTSVQILIASVTGGIGSAHRGEALLAAGELALAG